MTDAGNGRQVVCVDTAGSTIVAPYLPIVGYMSRWLDQFPLVSYSTTFATRGTDHVQVGHPAPISGVSILAT